jgi:hypothetical protein
VGVLIKNKPTKPKHLLGLNGKSTENEFLSRGVLAVLQGLGSKNVADFINLS